MAEGFGVEGVEEWGAGWGEEVGDGDRRGAGGGGGVVVGKQTGLDFREDSWEEVGFGGEQMQEHPAGGGDGVG